MLLYLDVKEKLRDLAELGPEDCNDEEISTLYRRVEELSGSIQAQEVESFKLTFVELSACGADVDRVRRMKAAAFCELSSKVAAMKLQLGAILDGVEVDVSEIGELSNASGLVLHQLRSQAQAGGGMVEMSAKIGLELSSLRAIASFMLAKA